MIALDFQLLTLLGLLSPFYSLIGAPSHDRRASRVPPRDRAFSAGFSPGAQVISSMRAPFESRPEGALSLFALTHRRVRSLRTCHRASVEWNSGLRRMDRRMENKTLKFALFFAKSGKRDRRRDKNQKLLQIVDACCPLPWQTQLHTLGKPIPALPSGAGDVRNCTGENRGNRDSVVGPLLSPFAPGKTY